jgi:hypothetical protein
MRRELAFSCYGAQLLVVDTAGADVCVQLESLLPPSIIPSDGSAPDACFVIDRPEPRKEGQHTPYRILRHGEVLMRARTTERLVKRLRQEIDEAVAIYSRRGLFVHAGVVGWRGHAIVVPGRSMTGKSHLVGELVRCGATYYSDEFAVLGDDGRVHPYARMPVIRSETDGFKTVLAEGRAAGEPLPIALVVATLFSRHATWKPAELRGARAVLPIIDNTVLAQSETGRLLNLCRLIAPTLVTLHGPRPDAASVAPRILAFLDALIDARASSGGETPPIATTAPPVAAALALVDTARSVDIVAPPAAVAEASPLSEPFVLLLHWNGRFGNRMHQYAYGATYARINQCRFLLPSDWEGTQLFATQHHSLLPHAGLRADLSAPHDPTEHRLELARRVVPELKLIGANRRRQNYRGGGAVCFDDVCAFHPSIFAPMSRGHLLSVFEFSETVKSLDLYRRLEDRQGTYDIAHLRRDDISSPNYNRSNPQGYSVISRESYMRAFIKYGFDPARIEWVSDDYRRQWHTDRPMTSRGRWRYPVGSEVLPHVLFDWLEDFLRLYFARTIFRANSSFSWWAAFLAPQARVFSPIIDSQHIYGVDGMEEISVDFVEGNHPHWMFDNADIVIGA